MQSQTEPQSDSVSQLAEGVRRRLGPRTGEEWALTRPNSRQPSRLAATAAAAADLTRPDSAAMPFFEDEGWPA